MYQLNTLYIGITFVIYSCLIFENIIFIVNKNEDYIAVRLCIFLFKKSN